MDVFPLGFVVDCIGSTDLGSGCFRFQVMLDQTYVRIVS